MIRVSPPASALDDSMPLFVGVTFDITCTLEGLATVLFVVDVHMMIRTQKIEISWTTARGADHDSCLRQCTWMEAFTGPFIPFTSMPVHTRVIQVGIVFGVVAWVLKVAGMPGPMTFARCDPLVFKWCCDTWCL